MTRQVWMPLGVVGLMATLAGQSGPAGDVALFARDVMVPMRDGVRLATDIYRPASNGVPRAEPLPVATFQVKVAVTSYRPSLRLLMSTFQVHSLLDNPVMSVEATALEKPSRNTSTRTLTGE